MTATTQATQDVEFLTAKACSQRYGFSVRHWLRLVDTGRAPQPARFGRLTRWRVESLEQWEKDGCPRIDRRVGR